MSLFSKLFGGGREESAAEAKPVAHAGFRIFVEPISESGGYRVAARIEKTVGDEVLIHQMIRADTINDLDEARRTTLFKAKQLIDQQGDGIFG
jgi:hypothetical protein